MTSKQEMQGVKYASVDGFYPVDFQELFSVVLFDQTIANLST